MMEALIGVIVGSFIPWIKDSLQQRRSRTEQGTYLAVRVICILDEYVNKCVEVVQDDGTVMQASERDCNGYDFYTPQVPLPPAPIFPDDVNWKSLDSDLMYRILAFPNAVRSTGDYISWVFHNISSPPINHELFEAIRNGYTDLGLEAIKLVELLKKRYDLPKKSSNKWNPGWNPKQYLEREKKDIEDRMAKQFAACISLDNISDNKASS